MEPRLTKQSEAILARLKLDMREHTLTKEQVEFLRKGMVLQESLGILARFVIGAAAFLGAGLALFTFFPGGGK